MSDATKLLEHHMNSVKTNVSEENKNHESPVLRREFAVAVLSQQESLKVRLESDLQTLENTECFFINHPAECKTILKEKRSKKLLLICSVESVEEIDSIGAFLEETNIPTLLIGPKDYNISLHAGKYNIQSYLDTDQYHTHTLIHMIYDLSQKVVKSSKSGTNVQMFMGISGGVGTTTITMNYAIALAESLPDKNILYLDLSSTKAISNLFFGIPKPEFSLIDALEQKPYTPEHLMHFGLYEVRDNFHMIAGIQSHIEREKLFSVESEKLLIEMLEHLKKHYHHIIIDGGIAEDVDLKITLQEICDEIFLVSELTTAHIAILKTLYELIRKAGWKDKAQIIINRTDSEQSISVTDARKILNLNKKEEVIFSHFFPNESDLMRQCWNYGELIGEKYPKSEFFKALNKQLIGTNAFEQNKESHGMWQSIKAMWS